MPTDEENVKYLYLVLTHESTPTIDWDPICTTLNLQKSAATKRWSRLKQAMEKGDNPGPTAYQLLWLCTKHSTRTGAPDWQAIAKECNTTAGAASKRYSRMKQAFEQGAAPPDSTPGSAVKGKATPKSTPRKTKASTDSIEGTPTPAPKRKRASPVKKTPGDDVTKTEIDANTEDDKNLEDENSKRAKITKVEVTPKPNSSVKVKKEVKPDAEDGEDAFFDAQEQADEHAKTATDDEYDSNRVHAWLSDNV